MTEKATANRSMVELIAHRFRVELDIKSKGDAYLIQLDIFPLDPETLHWDDNRKF